MQVNRHATGPSPVSPDEVVEKMRHVGHYVDLSGAWAAGLPLNAPDLFGRGSPSARLRKRRAHRPPPRLKPERYDAAEVTAAGLLIGLYLSDPLADAK